jgi:hypothetical protein
VESRQDLEWTRREANNGVYAADFIQAVFWCAVPEIRDALADISKRTNDSKIKAALGRKNSP